MRGGRGAILAAAAAGLLLVGAGAAGLAALVDVPVGISAEPVGAGDQLVRDAPSSAGSSGSDQRPTSAGSGERGDDPGDEDSGRGRGRGRGRGSDD